MSLQFKQNVNPNQLATEPDEQYMLATLKMLRKTYVEGVVRPHQISTVESVKDANPVLSSMFREIRDRHDRNVREMGVLVKEWLEKYQKIRGVTLQQEEKEDQDQHADTYSPHSQFLQSILYRLQSLPQQQLHSLSTLSLPHLTTHLSQSTSTPLQHLLEFITLLGITHPEQLLGVIRTGNLMLMKESEDETNRTGTGSVSRYLLTELGDIAVMVIVEKLENGGELSEWEGQIIREVMGERGEEDSGEIGAEELVEAYREYQVAAEMQQAERQLLENAYLNIKQRICDFIDSKQNYSQVIQRAFECSDPSNSGLITYPLFHRIFESLHLITPSQILTLFRYCTYLQFGTPVQIIDRSQKVSYLRLLSDLLNTKSLVLDQDQQSLQRVKTHNQHLERRIVQADHLINSLAQEKEELMVVVMDSQKKVREVEDRCQRVLAQGVGEAEGVKRQYHRETMLERMRVEAEIRRLNTIVENQNRVMESYRAELENIMNEVQERHR